jgi:hypothetical protein
MGFSYRLRGLAGIERPTVTGLLAGAVLAALPIVSPSERGTTTLRLADPPFCQSIRDAQEHDEPIPW